MRCKKHPTDLSCSVGVCASCLRERLLILIAAQAQAQAQQQALLARAHSRAAVDDHRRKPDRPPLIFPRSVSPYVTRQKSDHGDIASALPAHHHHHHQLFYSTPQVGPTYSSSAHNTTDFSTTGSFKKKSSRFSMLSNLFRSRSENFNSDLNASDPRVSSHDSWSSNSSPSWFPTIFPGRRKKQSRMFYLDEAVAGDRKPCRIIGRGMSPAMGPDSEEYETSSSAEASPGRWKRTPVSGPPATRRIRPGYGKNVSGLAFCLSPLVRASPSRHWGQKGGFPPDMAFSGEIRGPMKPHISTAASFCANRSRKLADFGRVNHNR